MVPVTTNIISILETPSGVIIAMADENPTSNSSMILPTSPKPTKPERGFPSPTFPSNRIGIREL